MYSGSGWNLWFYGLHPSAFPKNTVTTVQPRIPSKGEASIGAEIRNPPWHSTFKLHRVEHKIPPCQYFHTRTAPDTRLANPSPALPSSSPQKTRMYRRQTEPLGSFWYWSAAMQIALFVFSAEDLIDSGNQYPQKDERVATGGRVSMRIRKKKKIGRVGGREKHFRDKGNKGNKYL